MATKTPDVVLDRIAKVQARLSRWCVDGVVLTHMPNIRYFSGFTGSDGLMLIGANETRLMVDSRYTLQAAAECGGLSVSEYQRKHLALIAACRDMGLKSIGLESPWISAQLYDQLSKELGREQLVLLASEVSALRASKDQAEVAIMKKAAAIGSKAIALLTREVKAGWTERDCALALEFVARKAGAEGMAFDPIVASGKNSALPHAKPSSRRIRKGEFVVIDFGVRYRGYCSDETCTFAFGELTDNQKNAYRAAKRAHDEAISMIRPGMKAVGVDTAVRRLLGKEFSRFFTHGTGHGVGLEVHEVPRLAPGSTDRLETGMVLTIEPGLYFPGQWGIRIEDTVLIGENGCEKLTKMNKELTTIE